MQYIVGTSTDLVKLYTKLPVAVMFVNGSKRNEQYLYRGVHRLLPTKIQFIGLSGFRRNDFLEIDQSETRIAFGGHVC